MKKRQLKIPLEMGVLMVTDQQKMDFSVFKKLPKFLWGYSSNPDSGPTHWFAVAQFVSDSCVDWGYLHIYSGDKECIYVQGIYTGLKDWRTARRMLRDRGVYEQEP